MLAELDKLEGAFPRSGPQLWLRPEPNPAR